MGLDMYLNSKMYVKNWEHTPAESRTKITCTINKKRVDTKKVMYLEFEVAYWRKDNHIHRWFVENVQDGVDNCQSHHVPHKKLKELVKLCGRLSKLYREDEKEALKYAKEILPTQEGFFFGDTGYDEYYWGSLEETLVMLSDIDEDLEYYYQSSW
tara:strand:- start:8628 stop:9092 length:465 start_codon:yes stop_codon:yes gene_type:complete